jgi:hypothetical protein
MIKNTFNTYSGVRVSLDNQSYEKCVFTNCTIEYAGTGPISLEGCSFNNCQWVFTGHAQNTLNFMKVMYHQMGKFGKSMIEATFENIKQGVEPITNNKE